jgi:hypothetical protein
MAQLKIRWQEIRYRFWYWLLHLARKHIQKPDNPYLTEFARQAMVERYSSPRTTGVRDTRRRY